MYSSHFTVCMVTGIGGVLKCDEKRSTFTKKKID
jgi:hypothetical protein